MPIYQYNDNCNESNPLQIEIVAEGILEADEMYKEIFKVHPSKFGIGCSILKEFSFTPFPEGVDIENYYANLIEKNLSLKIDFL